MRPTIMVSTTVIAIQPSSETTTGQASRSIGLISFLTLIFRIVEVGAKPRPSPAMGDRRGHTHAGPPACRVHFWNGWRGLTRFIVPGLASSLGPK